MPRRTCHALLATLVAAPLLFFAALPAEAGCSKPVFLYSTSWCPYCRQVRAILARNHINYILLDATTAPVQADMIRRFGDTAVPRILVGDALVEGVDEARIKQLCRGRPARARADTVRQSGDPLVPPRTIIGCVVVAGLDEAHIKWPCR